MKKLLFAFFLFACTPTEPNQFADTLVAPVNQLSAVVVNSGVSFADVEMIGPGGRDNLFIRGAGGGWVELDSLPVSKGDSIFVLAAAPLPSSTPTWIKNNASYIFSRKLGGIVAEGGTMYGDGGAVKWDASMQPYIKNFSTGASADTLRAGEGRWGFGGGGSLQTPQDGYIRIRLYSR
jgi:hypothetical protein